MNDVMPLAALTCDIRLLDNSLSKIRVIPPGPDVG